MSPEARTALVEIRKEERTIYQHKVVELDRAGHTIAAVQIYRHCLGGSLREARDWIYAQRQQEGPPCAS